MSNNKSSTVFASKEIKEQRHTICKTCEYYLKAFKGCEKCGCLIPAKIQFTVNECPVGKW